MRHSLLDDFSVEELNKLLEESGTQKKLAERLEVSPALISKYLGTRRTKKATPKATGWVTKAEPTSETAQAVEPPVVQTYEQARIPSAVQFDQMEVGVKGRVFSYTILRDHIEIWGGKDGVMLTYDEIPQFYVELSDALKVADKLHGVLKPYMQEDTDVGQDQP